MRLRQRDDSGVATIFVILTSVLLLGAVGISVDVARAVAVTRSAQNSADAVALAMAKDCVVQGHLSSAGYDRFIRTVPAIGNGQSQSLAAGSCSSLFVTARASETMNFTISKVFGATNTPRSRQATAKWGQLAAGVIFPFAFSSCSFPDTFTSGTSSTPGTLLMLYGQGVRTGCTRDGSTTGQSSNSKGFIFNGCQLTSIGGTLTDANGNSFVGTACDGGNLDAYVGKDILLPVWGSATSNPGGSIYTITNLVGFHVLGWSGNGSSKGGAMSDRCTASAAYGFFKGDPTTLGDSNKPCLFGYVTSFTSTTGGTTGAPCVGSSDSLQPACFVYLSS
jgi:Flp pilus assembly protein TadG